MPGAAPRSVAGSVYAGVDARAAEIVDRARLPKSLQYPYAAVRSLATYRPGRYRVSVDGAEREYAAATVVVPAAALVGRGPASAHVRGYVGGSSCRATFVQHEQNPHTHTDTHTPHTLKPEG